MPAVSSLCCVTVAHRHFRRYVLLMKLKTHDRYDYVALRGRADYAWPGGRRLAVYFALNLEHFSFGEGLGAELAPAAAARHSQLRVARLRQPGRRPGTCSTPSTRSTCRWPRWSTAAMYDYAPSARGSLSHARRRDRGPRPHQRRAPGSSRRSRRARARSREATARMTEGEGRSRKAGWARGFRTAIARLTCWPRRATAICSTGAWTISRSGSAAAAASGSWRCPIRRKLNDIPAIAARKMGARHSPT